eukprot:TRINITY_DN2674_c0_g1_i7.p1 TRINITY_DN2674_c0_g1~~TRINITY_DN2674_c0_g1_i7.p1  ORF type:complete len:132 (-),score=39.89 TRINITY_DN2674_c0_g1_i7:66-461(-)
MYKFFLPSVLLSCATALPQYAPAPAYKAVAVEKALPPQPYTYQYGVADDYSKANFQKAESQDEGGNVQGEYTIALPDGRIQHTKYTADPLNGYIADVTYEGTPVYPPEPAGGYGNAVKAVVAGPAYKPGRR